ncbi:glycine-rich RNA-binding protein GRP2A [Gossypium hirsutum]|uniref:Glycine-rich RNA-binding protein GRP2A n=1 Tax=Gossypium hirsutum TaxID=3635 RepID=A0ABM3AZG1_GOSHI|nr:glycine-rich RNA-binding protein GRP2A-like [Gossypium hirsutum]
MEMRREVRVLFLVTVVLIGCQSGVVGRDEFERKNEVPGWSNSTSTESRSFIEDVQHKGTNSSAETLVQTNINLSHAGKGGGNGGGGGGGGGNGNGGGEGKPHKKRNHKGHGWGGGNGEGGGGRGGQGEGWGWGGGNGGGGNHGGTRKAIGGKAPSPSATPDHAR